MLRAGTPLAEAMRPTRIDDVVGQQHLLGPGMPLRSAIDAARPHSMLLWGPPGVGKTTLARLLAQAFDCRFIALSAVLAGVKDIREAVEQARLNLQTGAHGTIVFVDEVHRFNKAQQDAFLPHVEDGTIVLIGATTENPYFSVISPLLSRCRLFAVEKLSTEGLRRVVERALADRERGLGALSAALDEDAMTHLVEGAGGDARAALNALELAVLNVQPGPDGVRRVTVADAEAALQMPVLKYDRAGDEHYDTISAFIKSMRGSDPDAAIYWLAKMLEAGEDARFIARRIVIQAAEDVGLADPTALRVAIAAADAVEYIGLPEAQIPLAMAAIHVATSPKSNSACKAIAAAREDVRREGAATVPGHLAGGMRPGDKRSEYLYPHDHPGGWVRQSYLPPELGERRYYQPGDNAREAKISAWLAHLRRGQAEAASEAVQPGGERPARAEGDGLED
jgi:putative ATPase